MSHKYFLLLTELMENFTIQKFYGILHKQALLSLCFIAWWCSWSSTSITRFLMIFSYLLSSLVLFLIFY